MRVGLSWLRILGDLVHFVCLGLLCLPENLIRDDARVDVW